MGGADITDDIASAFNIRRAQAERLKCVHGSAQNSPRDNHEMLEIGSAEEIADGAEPPRISRAQLIQVIRLRLDHWMDAVAKALTELGYVLAGDQPEEFAAFIKSEIATLGKIIWQTGAKAE